MGRHTLISVGQRGRGRHLLSEGLSPKVGRTGEAQLEPPFSRIPPLGRSHPRRQEHFPTCFNTDGGRRSGQDWPFIKHVEDKLGAFSFYPLLLTFLCFLAQSLLYSPRSLQLCDCDGSADEAWKRGLLLSQLRASAAPQLFRNLK